MKTTCTNLQKVTTARRHEGADWLEVRRALQCHNTSTDLYYNQTNSCACYTYFIYLLLVFCNFLECNWQGYTNLLKILQPTPKCVCWQDNPRQFPHLGPAILEWPVNLTVKWHFVLSALNWYKFLLMSKTLKLLGTNTQNFAARVTRCSEFVHPCKYALYI